MLMPGVETWDPMAPDYVVGLCAAILGRMHFWFVSQMSKGM
jgi:hypothetical protein